MPQSIGSIDDVQAMLAELGISDPLPKFDAASVTTNPIDIFRSYVAEEMSKITGVNRELLYPALEWTQNMEKGDLILAVPRLRIKGDPKALAAEWVKQFPENKYVLPPVAANQFIQFFFNPTLLAQLTIPSILSKAGKYGANHSGAGKKALIEFSSVNIAKPFHAGHLRSTIIGAFLSNVYEFCDWEVVRMNYLGDWGKQFGLLAVEYEASGSEEKLNEDPIQHLFDIYVKANNRVKEEEAQVKDGVALEGESMNDKARAYFKKMEDGDPKALELWERFRELSIVKCEKVYGRLNIKFDIYSGESQVSPDTMAMASKIMEEKGISEDSEGAKIVDFPKHGYKKLGKAIIQKKDGTTLYLTRDIGAAIERHEKYQFDQMIYVVSTQQDLHLDQLFTILKLMGMDFVSKCVHVNFGLVHGMKTRTGEVVFLDSILDEVGEAMHEVMKKNQDKYQQVENPDEVADTIGKSAIMIQDMTGKRINNYPFDIKRMTSFEGDTGPYLQYAHARLCSILRKANIPMPLIHTADLTLITEPQAILLLRTLAQFPDVITNTLKTLEPTTIVNYLFKMTQLLSSSYEVVKVVGSEENVARARMALFESARTVLSNAMKLLGLTPVER
ncbi:cytoplasmic arginine--tRNA ligase [Drechslerella stenobrocha 248]|uniref:arginine--tRNA ligase n=1 Tax=Drechslerella stenobrocha 248 TaxID=1043628 RepID=W7I4E3_9PEZI|nr:cytoplasmic arginine--tRNA ligase [Drechslerella stenobrocha 248]